MRTKCFEPFLKLRARLDRKTVYTVSLACSQYLVNTWDSEVDPRQMRL